MLDDFVSFDHVKPFERVHVQDLIRSQKNCKQITLNTSYEVWHMYSFKRFHMIKHDNVIHDAFEYHNSETSADWYILQNNACSGTKMSPYLFIDIFGTLNWKQFPKMPSQETRKSNYFLGNPASFLSQKTTKWKLK